jgi:hypothetical protein
MKCITCIRFPKCVEVILLVFRKQLEKLLQELIQVSGHFLHVANKTICLSVAVT